MNARTILDLVKRSGPISRAEVARASGLSKPTVSLGLAALLEAGLVREMGRSSGGRGPTAVLYELNPEAGRVVGIDVGRYWVRAALADITGSIVARRDERAKISSARALIGQIGSIARGLATEAETGWDRVSHVIVGSHGLVEALRDELGSNVGVENDVNLAAVGEQWKGHGQGVRNFGFLSVGTGVGMGLVLGGELYRGSSGAAGEVAYLPVGADPYDHHVRRRGAFEEATSGAGVIRVAHEVGMKGTLTPKRVFALARKRDPLGLQVVEREAQRLALGLAAVAAVVDLDLVILGGGIGGNADLLLDPIGIQLRTLSPLRPRLVASALGDDVVLHGALATALAAAQDRLFDPARLLDQKELVV